MAKQNTTSKKPADKPDFEKVVREGAVQQQEQVTGGTSPTARGVLPNVIHYFMEQQVEGRETPEIVEKECSMKELDERIKVWSAQKKQATKHKRALEAESGPISNILMGMARDVILSHPEHSPETWGTKENELATLKETLKEHIKTVTGEKALPRVVTQVFSDAKGAAILGVDFNKSRTYWEVKQSKLSTARKAQSEGKAESVAAALDELRIIGKDIKDVNTVKGIDGKITKDGTTAKCYREFLAALNGLAKEYKRHTTKAETKPKDAGSAERKAPKDRAQSQAA